MTPAQKADGFKELIFTPAPAKRGMFGIAANENFSEEELPTAISPEKAKARLQIAAICDGKPVTICKPGPYPDGLTKWRPSSRPANDNTREPQSWPLAEALRREEGRRADIELCEIYRGLWAVMASNPLQGRDVEFAGEDDEIGLRVEVRGGLDGYDAFKATGEVKGTGDINYHEVRKTPRTPGVPTKALPKGEGEAGERYTTTTVRFNEDTMIAQMDMRQAWLRLRMAIRPVLEPFEDACLDAATLSAIGEGLGFNGKQASAAGKALVFAAIDTLRAEWQAIQSEMRFNERQAERNVARYRARREKERAAFLGKAA